MNSDRLAPIPIPLSQRWHDARGRLVPVLVLGATVGALAFLWRGHVAAPMMVGQAEPVVADVNSHKPGVLAELNVVRFQRVQAGDILGRVMVTEPRVLESSLAVIRAEIEMLRVNMRPIATAQHNALDYNRVRLEWMRQRADLASARVNLQLAETELRRTELLFKEKISSQQKLDEAKAAYGALQQQVDEMALLVAEGDVNFRNLQPTNTTDMAVVTEDPLHAAIAVQESKLRLTEAELSPITLRAPIDGTVTVIYRRPGEAIIAGQPIVGLATLNPVRIVGYLRAPLVEEPKLGTRVDVRTRGWRREVGVAQVVAVGTQMEAVPVALLGPVKMGSLELGLPLEISLPANLRIRPGELVDLRLGPQAD
jgi:multidrug resistance efflux pump